MMKCIVILSIRKLGYYNIVFGANLLFKPVERLKALLGLLFVYRKLHILALFCVYFIIPQHKCK